MTEADGRRPGRTYEVTVAGELGPVLRAAFPDQSVLRLARCTVLVLHAESWGEVVDLLTEGDLRVQEVRLTRHG